MVGKPWTSYCSASLRLSSALTLAMMTDSEAKSVARRSQVGARDLQSVDGLCQYAFDTQGNLG